MEARAPTKSAALTAVTMAQMDADSPSLMRKRTKRSHLNATFGKHKTEP
jgi:hypothetical protein